jgi:hypothetical protein
VNDAPHGDGDEGERLCVVAWVAAVEHTAAQLGEFYRLVQQRRG